MMTNSSRIALRPARGAQRLVLTAAAAAVLASLALPAAAAPSLSLPSQGSSLYYRIGGGAPLGGAANPGSLSLRVGLGGNARMNYTCGKFNADVTIANLMNQFSQIGTAVTSQIQAGIAALPMYILQRAQPGLYELLQSYLRQSQSMFNIALQSCEQMEAEIKSGGDPYAKWVGIAKSENWKTAAGSTVDVVQAKTQVETTSGKAGMTWVGGTPKGGAGQPPIEVIRDLTQAGYNVTQNQAPAASPTATFTATGPTATKLAVSFPNARAAADWAVQVLGDVHYATCDDGACPPKGAVPGTGLLPRFEQEKTQAEQQMLRVVNGSGVPARDDLIAASAPGVAVTRDLVEAIRALPPTERSIMTGRIAQEIAQARTIDRALLVRNLLLTGAGLPEATHEPAQNDVRARINQLNRYIEDMLMETRVRREITSFSADALLREHERMKVESGGTPTAARSDRRPLENGRVQQ